MSRGRSEDQSYDEIQAEDIVILAAGVNTGSRLARGQHIENYL